MDRYRRAKIAQVCALRAISRALAVSTRRECQNYPAVGSIVLLGTINAFSQFGGPFKITVLNTHGTNVKLEFEVDPDVPVHRSKM
jgi:hypothetical protein